MTVQELVQKYTDERDKYKILVVMPVLVMDDGGENHFNFGRKIAYADVLMTLERHVRGDYPLKVVARWHEIQEEPTSVLKIITDIRDNLPNDSYSQVKREIYDQAITDISSTQE